MFADKVRNGVLVVAHPDDEILWCGGLLARFRGRWSVICCSIPRADPIRAWKFFSACASIGTPARLLPFVESDPGLPLRNLEALDLASFDCIVTHNAGGEYGHRHHQSVHGHVMARWAAKTATIGYRQGGQGQERLDLSRDERAAKLVALRHYDHVAPSDNARPKWRALLDRYCSVNQVDFGVETYDPPVA